MTASQTCNTCHRTQPLTEFAERHDRPGKHYAICAGCKRAKAARHYETRQTRVKAQARAGLAALVETGVTEKTCSACGASVPLSGFHRNLHRPDGLKTTCIECDRAKDAGRAR